LNILLTQKSKAPSPY